MSLMMQKQFIDTRLHQLRLVCQAQWDYLGYSDVEKWLMHNFQNDIEGRYYATKILLHTLYYKKMDLEKLLEYGLHQKIYGEIIKNKLISDKNIYLPSSVLESEVSRLKQASFFIPLLDSGKPSESGNTVIGDLVHKLNVTERQVAFQWDVNEEILKEHKMLIFVDDCVGSGNQLKRFWKSEQIKRIRLICNTHNIKIYYLVYIGYSVNLEKLKSSHEIEGINVVVCDVLTDKNRVFSDESIIWDKKTNEREKALFYFENLRKLKGVNFLGYKNLDFAVILHDRVPNWTLPLFWKQSTDWKILLRRKTS